MKKKGCLLQYINWSTVKRIPIFILDINISKLFPVRYRFKGKGYTDLEFTARLSEIELID